MRGLLLILLCAAPARAINGNAGTSAAQFLKLGAGSRAAGMGEAYSAVADDVYAMYYNPAALTRLKGSQLAAAHAEHFQGISYEFAGFAAPVGGRHAVGAAVYNLSITDIERRTGDTRSPTGSFGAGDYSYNISYAYRASDSLSLGLTGKFIHESIDSYSAGASAADFGALYTASNVMGRPLWLSAVVKNLGSDISFAGVSDPLPRGFVAGAGMPVTKAVRVGLDLTKYRDTDLFLGAGAEYRHLFTADVSGAVRGGVNTARKDNDGMNLITVGAGVNFYRAGFDFAWVPFGDLGNTFRFSLLLAF